MKYDYLIVGAGLFGSIFAREITNIGKTCLIIDKRNHIGGNCWSENINGINVCKYGIHVFHTPSIGMWNYVNKHAVFNHFTNRVKVKYKDKVYSFPINLLTFHQIWGISTPDEARKLLEKKKIQIDEPKNLEEWCLSQIGEELYEIFYKGYTKKQWKKDPKHLPMDIAKRIPIKFDYDDSYYGDRYEGVPIGGYQTLFNNLLVDSSIKLNCDYFDNKEYWDDTAKRILFTGKIDEFYNYEYGELEYTTCDFNTRTLEGDFQGVAQVNYTDENIPHTRTHEHKYLEFKEQTKTVVTWETPTGIDNTKVPLYPLNDEKNNRLYRKYSQLTKSENPNIIFGGRLAEYKYYDMKDIISKARQLALMEIYKG